MAAAEQTQEVHVLTLEAIRWAIDALKSVRIHPFFLAYLHLRKQAAEQGTADDIAPDWDELGTYLAVRGGPPGKPYYRPLWNGKGVDPGRYWLNPNLAGSYSPSSIRNVPMRVVDINGSHFSLKPDHAQLALKHLLYDEPVSTIALAAFLYREFGLISSRAPAPSDLGDMLREDFHYLPSDEEFSLLFGSAIPTSVDRWFEPLDANTVGVV